MMFLLILFVAIVVGIISVRTKFPKIKEEATKAEGDDNLWVTSGTFWKCLVMPVLIIIFGFINPFKIERVDAGHVGIKVNLTGDNRGVSRYEYRTGWVIYNNWFAHLYEFPTYQQHIDYDEQQIISKGGFPAIIKPSFNYALKPGDVGDMFQTLRLDIKEIEKQWLHTAIVGAVNDVANKWTVDSIFNYREQFEANIVKEANHRVEKWFLISQLRTNITPPASLVESIQKKTQAIQDVQVAENQKLVAQAEAQRKIATARGDSAQMVIGASAEARTIMLRKQEITQEYIEYLKAIKWDGVLPSVQAGNSGMFLNVNKP